MQLWTATEEHRTETVKQIQLLRKYKINAKRTNDLKAIQNKL